MLKQVKQNWKDDTFFIDLSIGNICNYQCNYCFPGANEGNHKWPDYDLLVRNTTHLLDYYMNKTNKRVFDIHFVGGEPTHWPKLLDFIQYLKKHYDCLISMTSNGSKKLDYWKLIAPYFDRVNLSYHHKQADIETFRTICDYLYEQRVVFGVNAMMDPHHWDKCMHAVDYLKQSKHKWSIRYSEILGPNYVYTQSQKQTLEKHRARGSNWLWFWRNNKYYTSRVKIVDDRGERSVKDNTILLERLNNFKGWHCSVGVNWIHVAHDGTISGTCGQTLYGEEENYNLRDADFIKKFKPVIREAVCGQSSCNCLFETNMPKRAPEMFS